MALPGARIIAGRAKLLLKRLDSPMLPESASVTASENRNILSGDDCSIPTDSFREYIGNVLNVDIGNSGRLDNFHRRNHQASNSTERMKQTSYVNTYFVNQKFNSDIAQSIAVTIRDYRLCAILCDLDEAAMAKNFSSCLSDPARSFFLSNVKHEMTFSEIEEFMIAEYNSNSRQIQVRKKLEAPDISSIMAEKGISFKHHALTDAINKIDILVSQCFPIFRAEDQRSVS